MILYSRVALNVNKRWGFGRDRQEKLFHFDPKEPCDIPDEFGEPLLKGRPDIYSLEPFEKEPVKEEVIEEVAPVIEEVAPVVKPQSKKKKK